MNKKLVIAALLAAAYAEGDEENQDAQNEEENQDVVEEEDDEGVPEEERPDWEVADIILDEDGVPVENQTHIYCDQADATYWIDAEAHFKDLQRRHSEAKIELENATNALTPYQEAFEETESALNTHDEENETFTTTYNALAEELEDLTREAGATTQTEALQGQLDDKVEETNAAIQLVKDQRDRIRDLVVVSQTQAQIADSIWADRIQQQEEGPIKDATDALAIENEELTLIQETLTKRSYLFRVLRELQVPADPGNDDTTLWNSACDNVDNDGSPDCQFTEVISYPGTTTTSTWRFESGMPEAGGCDILDQAGDRCTILGLQGEDANDTTYSSGLKQSAAKWKEIKDNALNDLDHDVKTVSGTNDGGGNELTIMTNAKNTFTAYMNNYLLTQTMLSACFYAAGADATTDTVTEDSNCTGNLGILDGTNTSYFNPLIQGQADAAPENTARSVYVDLQSNLQSAFTTADGNFEHATRAAAQVEAWQAQMLVNQIDGEIFTITDEDTGSLPYQQGIVNQKQGLLNAALDQKRAMQIKLQQAINDKTNSSNDLTKANELLEDLIKDIAPAARQETELRAELAIEQEKDVEKEEAAQKRTIAEENMQFADQFKKNIDTERELLQNRHNWSIARRASFLQKQTDLQNEVDTLFDDMKTASAALVSARNACKSAAFDVAEDARNAAIELQNEQIQQNKDVIADYASKAAFPTDGSDGTLCHRPEPTEDDPSPSRLSNCEVEGEETLEVPRCCGAAQRFLKDGTKLSIETCQPEDTTTYKYYRALEDGELVAPTPETWRFHCISAAQKLAAAAAATLAAGYMMA